MRTTPFARRLVTGATLLTVSALLAACATMQSTPEERVAQRAQARWNVLLSGKPRDAYDYLSPASRAISSYEAWLTTAIPTSTVWKAATVTKVECVDAQRCKARVNIDHQPLAGGGVLGTISSSIDETWLVDNGEWWLLYTR